MIIWLSNIRSIDLTTLVHLKLVICGKWWDGSDTGLQDAKVNSGVVKRVMSGSIFDCTYKDVK